MYGSKSLQLPGLLREIETRRLQIWKEEEIINLDNPHEKLKTTDTTVVFLFHQIGLNDWLPDFIPFSVHMQTV